MDAVIEMMRLVKYVRAQLPLDLAQPLLVIYSPADQVVDTARITRAFEQMNSPRRQLVEIPESGDPSNHVLAGSIMSPETTSAVADGIVEFIKDDDSVDSGPG